MMSCFFDSSELSTNNAEAVSSVVMSSDSQSGDRNDSSESQANMSENATMSSSESNPAVVSSEMHAGVSLSSDVSEANSSSLENESPVSVFDGVGESSSSSVEGNGVSSNLSIFEVELPESDYSSPSTVAMLEAKEAYLAAVDAYEYSRDGAMDCLKPECQDALTAWQDALTALHTERDKLTYSKSATWITPYAIKSMDAASLTYISEDYGCGLSHDENGKMYREWGGESYDTNNSYTIENGTLKWITEGDDCSVDYYSGGSQSLTGVWNYEYMGSIIELADECNYIFPDARLGKETGTIESDGLTIQFESTFEYNCLVNDLYWEAFAAQRSGDLVILDCNSWIRNDKGLLITEYISYEGTMANRSLTYELKGKSCTTVNEWSLVEQLDGDCEFSNADKDFNDCMQDMLTGFCEGRTYKNGPSVCDEFNRDMYDNDKWLQ